MDQQEIFQKNIFFKGEREKWRKDNYLLRDMQTVLGSVLDELSQRQLGKLPQKSFNIWMNQQCQNNCQMHGEYKMQCLFKGCWHLSSSNKMSTTSQFKGTITFPSPHTQLTYEPGHLTNILRKREHDLNNNQIHIIQYTILDNVY